MVSPHPSRQSLRKIVESLSSNSSYFEAPASNIIDDEKSEETSSLSEAVSSITITATTDTHQSNQHIIQNFLLMWLDNNIDESKEDCQNTLEQLHSVINNVNIFTELNECVDFLSEVGDEKAFMIVAGTIGEQIVPLIHDMPQLDAIYILCDNRSLHEQWVKEWVKVKGVHTEIKPIREALQMAAKQCDQDSIAVSYVTVDEGTSHSKLDQLDASFMYTQIFKEILLEMEHNDKSIQDLVLYCRKAYAVNKRELNIIVEFENKYQPQSSVWWYTRECFTYHMLNRALRTLEVDTIITMGFFIRDLHRQIQELHQNQVHNYHGQIFNVYRGQGLSTVDFDKLQKTKGGLMSFNNFLSTSVKREVSLRFAKDALTKTEMVGVLFEMTVDPSIASTPFATIDDVSYYKTEKEVLFSMHTVFRICAIKEIDNNNRLYQVELKLTADDDQQLRTLTKRIQVEVNGSGWQRLGDLLLKISQFNKAEELYTVLLEQTSDANERQHYYNQLGYIKDHQGHFEKAIWYYEKTLEVQEEIFHPNHPLCATSYNNIGEVYRNMGEYLKALSFYEKGLAIREKILPSNHLSLTSSYNNIGALYENIGEYSKTLSFYEKTRKILEETLPSNHPLLANSCNNIGTVYMAMGEHSKALLFFNKAFKIVERSLPPNDPRVATLCNNIAVIYEHIEDHLKALSFFEKVLEICQKTLPSNHPMLITTYNNIGTVYTGMGEHLKALSFYEKALKIIEENRLPNHPSLATSYNNFGAIYNDMGENSKALSFYEKALEILEKTLPPNHPNVASTYNNIGRVYEDMKEYSKALSFYEKSLKIRQETLPPNHPELDSSYGSIGQMHYYIGNYSKALSYFERRLDIKQRSLPPNHPSIQEVQKWIEFVKQKL